MSCVYTCALLIKQGYRLNCLRPRVVRVVLLDLLISTSKICAVNGYIFLQTVALLLLLVSSSMGCVSGPTITSLGVETLQQNVSGVDLDLCPTCVQFAGEFLNELLNIILS